MYRPNPNLSGNSLRVLKMLASQHSSVEITKECCVSRGRIQQIFNRLESLGYVCRCRVPYEVTENGKKYLESVS